MTRRKKESIQEDIEESISASSQYVGRMCARERTIESVAVAKLAPTTPGPAISGLALRTGGVEVSFCFHAVQSGC